MATFIHWTLFIILVSTSSMSKKHVVEIKQVRDEGKLMSCLPFHPLKEMNNHQTLRPNTTFEMGVR